MKGKTKGGIEGTSDYYKFMVILSVEDEEHSSSEAIQQLINNNLQNTILWNKNSELDKENVFILPIGLEN